MDGSPIDPGPLVPRSPATVWPQVFGIISIVLGVMGILGHGCNLVFSIAGAAIQDLDASLAMGVPEGPLFWVLLVEYAVAVGLGGWLLVAGVGIVRRRSGADRNLRRWAITKIVTSVVGTIAVLPLMDALSEAMEASVNPPGATGAPTVAGVGEPFAITMVVVGVVIALTWPVIVLVWLRRAAIKTEIRDWR